MAETNTVTTTTVEERIAAIQADVARLKAQAEAKGERYGVIGRTNPKVIAEMFGVFANDPDAEAVFKSIEDAREREREEARRAPAESHESEAE